MQKVKQGNTVENRTSGLLLAIIFVLVLLLLGGVIGVVAYWKRSVFLVAKINNTYVTRWDMLQALEKQYGKSVLGSMVSKQLILEEAEKNSVTVSEEEIQDEITKLQETVKSQGKEMDAFLAERHLTMDDLREQVRIQKLVVKMIIKDAVVTEKDVEDALQKMNPPKSAKPEELVSMRNQIRNNLQREKLDSVYASWSKSLQDKAQITFYQQYP